MKLILGDSANELKKMLSNSVDAIVTDPPYGLSFMGKKWDYEVPSVSLWQEALRVLKPGGHLLSFGGTRTYHRMVVNIEDAGFEIRDQVQWLYGSGFPKSTDVSKRIDKEAGAEREVIGLNEDFLRRNPGKKLDGIDRKKEYSGTQFKEGAEAAAITAPSTDSAKQWEGWGTALKPANEPICLARKPLDKGLTAAQNVLKWGCGALNIDASRIGLSEHGEDPRLGGKGQWNIKREQSKSTVSLPAATMSSHAQGRWPANIILDEEAAEALDIQRPEVSRFFYIAKPSTSERNAGLEGEHKNFHPTVKPVKLMEYLVRMITPPKGICLDPFMGSGTTGVACKNLGFEFIGIEREKEYIEIAKARLKNKQKA